MFVRNAFFSLSPRIARNNLARMILQRPYYLSSKRYYAVHVENRLPDKMLSVTWEDGKVSHFPHIYLRDNCPCKSCFDKGAGQRLTYNPVYNGFTKAAIKTARINGDNNVSIEWLNDDQHTSSIFQLDWLKANRFHTKYDDETKTIERRLWDSKIKDELPEFDFNHIISDNLMLYKWLRCVMETGIARVVNIPDGDGQLYKIADQVSHLRRSCYG